MNKKKLIGLVITVLTAIILLLQCFVIYKETGKVDSNKINEAVNTIVNAINASTTEIPNLKQEDEQVLEVQEKTETEGLQFQGNIEYNGDYLTENVPLGEYAGLTYYSQVDNRWKNHVYSSTGDNTQTIGTSGCGPTSAAMVVSSIKGVISPNKMGDLFVENGYRSANSGTYLSAFRWVADFFNIEYAHTSNVDKMVEQLKNNNYVIASCGSGLFTYGGHLIVITGVEGNMLKIYDPYLYNGKFETSTRRGKAEVKGNTVYVSIENFRKYANATNFYCYKNDREDVKENNTNTVVKEESTSAITNISYKVKVTARKGLNIRSGANTRYAKTGAYTKNTIVTVTAENNGWGKTSRGWICLAYTAKVGTSTNTNNNNSTKYVLGVYQVNTAKGLNVRSGAGINYSKKKVYSNKTKFDTYQIKGDWARTPSGWVCLKYCKLLRKY